MNTIPMDTETLIIYIDSKKIDLINSRSAIGICFESGDVKIYFTERLEYVGDEDYLLEYSLREALSFLEKMIEKEELPHLKKITVKTPMRCSKLIHEMRDGIYLRNSINSIIFLDRAGYKLNFDCFGDDSELKAHLKDAVEQYIEINEFNKDQIIFSPTILKDDQEYYLKQLFQKSVIQYVSSFAGGTPGFIKKVLLPEDLASTTSVLKAMEIVGYQFPSKSKYQNDMLQRIAMVIRDSDIVLLGSEFITSPKDGTLLDRQVIEICRLFDKPLFILNSNDSKWYTKSISKKRDYVIKRGVKIDLYKYIGVIFPMNIFATSLTLINKYFNKTK